MNGAKRTTSERFFSLLLEHRRLILGVVAGWVLVAGYGARHVGIDYSVEQFFLKWGPERETYDEYKQLFPREDTRVTLFWKDERELGVSVYRDMERVAAWFEAVGLEDVRWLGNVVVADEERIDGETAIAIGPLMPSTGVSDDALADALRRHGRDRPLNGILWDTAQTVFLIHGYVKQEDNTDPTRRRIETQLSDSLVTLDAPSAELVLTGLPIARARAPQLLESDIRVLLSAAFVMFFVILYWFFRKAAFAILSLISVAPAYLGVLGFLGYIDKPISILTSFIPVVVLVVGMSDAVHVLAEFRRRRRSGQSPHSAIVSTFSVLAGPCFYTSITTAVGFASLAGTRIDIVIDFGLLTAAAILLTFAFSMTVFPALLSVVSDQDLNDDALQAGWLRSVIDAAACRAGSPSSRPIVLAVLVAAVAGALAAQLRVNTYLIDDTKASAPFMQDIQWIKEHGFGFFQVNVLLWQTDERPLHDPEALVWMEELRHFVRDDALVTQVVALPDFIAPIRTAMLGQDVGQIPELLDEASQLLLLARLQDPTFVDEVYLEQQGVGQVIITVRDEGSLVMQPFLNRLDNYLGAHPFPVGTAEVTGTVTMIQSFTDRLLQSFGPSIVVAVVLITVIMMWMLRSVRLGLIALLTNLFPLVVLLGAMSALGFAIKPSTILVMSIAFGIAVDDTIHLLSSVVRHARRGQSITYGLERGIRETGAIIVVTTVIVMAGFLLLTVSHFQILFLIGLLTAVSAGSALVADLFVLPSIVGMTESRVLSGKRAPTVTGGG